MAESASGMLDLIKVSLDGAHVSAMVRVLVAWDARRGELSLLTTSTLRFLHLLLYAIINRKYLLL